MIPGDPDWRALRREQILQVARGARTEAGFGWLLDDGSVDSARPEQLWITARMTYVWSLAHAQGRADALGLAEHGVRALRSDRFRDPRYGGWFDDITGTDTSKRCYGHDFVLLAAATAARAGVPGADGLLDDAATIHLTHFWDAGAGRCVEEWDRSWSALDPYRGANSNMHAVEAYLATARATGEAAWLDRALSIAEHLIGDTARSHDWRVVEHFDADWSPRPDLNRDRPDDPFRPYGATPGHGLEWARLLAELNHARPTAWLLAAAEQLFARAVDDALDDAHPLLPYTTDWDGTPLVTERFHWVMAEAVSAAETLAAATGISRYRDLASRWWREIDDHLIDTGSGSMGGSWRHELTASLRPSTRTWHGRPDAYHAVNALTLPDRLTEGALS